MIIIQNAISVEHTNIQSRPISSIEIYLLAQSLMPACAVCLYLPPNSNTARTPHHSGT